VHHWSGDASVPTGFLDDQPVASGRNESQKPDVPKNLKLLAYFRTNISVLGMQSAEFAFKPICIA